ncbi:MAG: peptidoglycan DD-metalloendopeptidase family protein [bacterium]
MTLDGLGLFAHNDTLILGANKFSFRVEDLVKNQNSLSVNYYREESLPIISGMLPATLINNRKPLVSNTLTDNGYSDGSNTYISVIAPGSVYISLTHPVNGELVLVNNGVNTQPALGNIIENCAGPGQFGNSTAATCIYSFAFSADLTPDGNYQITTKVKDTAGNSAVDQTQAFELDSNILSDLKTPANGNLFNYSLIKLTGTAEKNSEITLSLPLGDLDNDGNVDSETIVVSDAATNASRVVITNCQTTSDPERDGIRETCDWELNDFQLERNLLVAGNITNQIKIESKDNIDQFPGAGLNTKTETINVNVDLFAVSLTINSDLEYFSPNGDGRQDGVNFIEIGTNGQILSYILEIRDDQGNLLKSFAAGGTPPASIPWDGRDQNGNYVGDGVYTYQLKITTTDGLTFVSPLTNLYAVTKLTDKVVITYPKNGSFSSRGVINVQGQAPETLVLSNGNSDLKIKICVDTVTIAGICDTEYYTTVDQNGSFSTIVMLPRLNTLDEHYLTATALDKYGNETPPSNQVKVTTTINPPFQSIEIIPVLTGTNDPAAYQLIIDKLNNGQTITQADLDSLRSVVFRATVFQGTERVKFFFADHSKLSELPTANNWNSLGYISGANQTKLYQEFVDGTTPYETCASVTCTWDFYFPLIPELQGLYEVRFEGKLDQQVVNLTAGFTVDGNIPTAPIILDINKISNGSYFNTNYYNNAFFSNSEIIQIKGASDPGAEIVIKDQAGNIICTTTVSAVGIFSCESDTKTIPAYSDPTSNVYPITLITFATLGLNTTPSVDNKTVVIDKLAPLINSLNTSSYWRQSGAPVDLNLTANELLSNAVSIDSQALAEADQCLNSYSSFDLLGKKIAIQQGAITDLNIDSNNQALASGAFVISGWAVEGRYCTRVKIYDLAGNFTEQGQQFFIDNTRPDAPSIDITGRGEFNGIYTKPTYIAKGRLVPEFVHEESKVTIKAWTEENTLLEFYVNAQLISTSTLAGLDCKGFYSNDRISDTVVVKDKDICAVNFDYAMTENGKDYVFQVKAVDRAGNKSIISEDQVVYYDIAAPRIPEVIRTFSPSYDPTPNWALGKNNSLTKDLGITLRTSAESLSDLEYWTTGPQNFSQYNFTQTPGNQLKDQYLTLGTTSDERDGCVSLQDTRRIGICEDGNYEIKIKSTDAAGNPSSVATHNVERDTVRPEKPVISVGKNGEPGKEHLQISISGEKNAMAVVTINIAGRQTQTVNLALSDAGIYFSNDLLGALACGQKTYVIIVRIIDQAGNASYTTNGLITTDTCPIVCGYAEGGTLALPIRPEYTITSGYKTIARPDHAGLDMVKKNGSSFRAEIYAAGNGTITYATQTGGVNLGKANYVNLAHDDGKFTSYWHLDNEETAPVTAGERVNDGSSIIGHMGETGQAYGIHLHFIVKVGGVAVNPEYYLGKGAAITCEVSNKKTDLSNGIDGTNPEKPWADLTWDTSKWANITFDRYFDGDQKKSRLKEANIPSPTLTFLQLVDKDTLEVYGVGMPKYQQMKVGVWNQYRNWCLGYCSTDWEFLSQDEKAENVQIGIYRKDGKRVGYVWNDDPSGRWKVTIKLTEDLQPGDHLIASTLLFDDFSFDKLHWWKDTYEQVTFSVNPAYSGNSNELVVPYTNPAEEAIRKEESEVGNVDRDGYIYKVCNTYIQDYKTIGNKGDSAIMYNPDQQKAYLITGGIWWSYNTYGGCEAFGVPNMDEDRTGKISGWYQKFTKGDIYWAEKEQGAQPGIVRDRIRDYYNSLSGTWSELDFPEGQQWLRESGCGNEGGIQNFQQARVYSTNFGSYHLQWGKFFDVYTKLGEYNGELGWLKTMPWKEWKGIHYTTTAKFEKGQLWLGTISYEEKETWGCDNQRDKDNQLGAPDDVIKVIHEKEDSAFQQYTRANSDLGIIHKFCNGWIVDYDNAVEKNGEKIGYTRIIYNPITVDAYILKNGISETYWGNNDCKRLGLPAQDETAEDNGGKYNAKLWTQKFDKGKIFFYQRSSGLLNTNKWYVGAVVDNAEILARYESMGGNLKKNILGLPISNTYWQISSCNLEGWIQEFDDGRIYSSKRGTFYVDKNDGELTYNEYVNNNQGSGLYEWATSDRDLTFANYDGTTEKTYYTTFQRGYIQEGYSSLLSDSISKENGWNCDNSETLYKKNLEYINTYGPPPVEIYKQRLKYASDSLNKLKVQIGIARAKYNNLSLPIWDDEIDEMIQNSEDMLLIWNSSYDYRMNSYDISHAVEISDYINSHIDTIIFNIETQLNNQLTYWVGYADKLAVSAYENPSEFIIGVGQGLPTCVTDTIYLVSHIGEISSLLTEIYSDPSLISDINEILLYQANAQSDKDSARTAGRFVGNIICEYLVSKGLSKLNDLNIVKEGKTAIKAKLVEKVRPFANILRKGVGSYIEFTPEMQEVLNANYLKYIDDGYVENVTGTYLHQDYKKLNTEEVIKVGRTVSTNADDVADIMLDVKLRKIHSDGTLGDYVQIPLRTKGGEIGTVELDFADLLNHKIKDLKPQKYDPNTGLAIESIEMIKKKYNNQLLDYIDAYKEATNEIVDGGIDLTVDDIIIDTYITY